MSKHNEADYVVTLVSPSHTTHGLPHGDVRLTVNPFIDEEGLTYWTVTLRVTDETGFVNTHFQTNIHINDLLPKFKERSKND